MNYNTTILCPSYRDFVRSKPCCVCANPHVDFDHLKARGFGSGKQNDLTGIPLCRKHHAERGQIGNERFEQTHRINLWQVAAMLLIEFFAVDPERRSLVEIHVSRKSEERGIFA